METQICGSRGEALVVRHVLRAGMKVLGRNVRLGRDEIDIIVFDPAEKVVAFVEVKTRSFGHDYHPSLNLDWRKRRHMVRAARRWVHLHGYDGGYRLDAAYVSGNTVEYVVDLDTMQKE